MSIYRHSSVVQVGQRTDLAQQAKAWSFEGAFCSRCRKRLVARGSITVW